MLYYTTLHYTTLLWLDCVYKDYNSSTIGDHVMKEMQITAHSILSCFFLPCNQRYDHCGHLKKENHGKS